MKDGWLTLVLYGESVKYNYKTDTYNPKLDKWTRRPAIKKETRNEKNLPPSND